MKRLFAQEVVALAAGWLFACLLHPVGFESRGLALVGLIALAALRRLREPTPWSIAAGGFLLCILLAGVAPERSAFAEHLEGDRADLLLVGTIVDGPRIGEHGASYVFDVTTVDEEAISPTRLRLWSPHRTEPDDVRAGDRVEIFARCGRFGPREFPHLPAADVRWERRGFTGRCTARETMTLVSRPPSIRRLLADRRRAVEETLLQMDQPAAGVATAMLTGTRGFVADEARDAFRDTGTGHLLAISGLHFGMLAGLTWLLVGWLLRRNLVVARRWGVRRASAIAVGLLMGGYLLLVGAPTSASRAWVVVAFVSLGLLLFRRSSGFAALAAAAILLTVARPTMVLDAGFRLSFCATAAIVCFWWRRPRAVDFDPYAYDRTSAGQRLRQVGAFVGMSWCATAVTWPVILGMTGRISTVAIVTNPLVVPWIGAVVFPTLLATTAFAMVTGVTEVLVIPEALIELTLVALEWFAAWPGSTWCPGVPRTGFVVVAVLVVFGAIVSRLRPRAVGATALVLGAMVAFLEYRQPEPSLRLHFIPVGQGDATLVEFPGGERVLFDAGGTRFGRDPGRWVVVPYLWRQGIDELDAVVVTHDDVDHSGGVPAVLNQIEVDRLIEEPEPLGVPGVELERLVDEGSKNDRSLVATIRQLGATVLLTGDIERAGEARWVAPSMTSLPRPLPTGAPAAPARVAPSMTSLPRPLPTGTPAAPAPWEGRCHFKTPYEIAVLKVPHHGSATSSSPEFLDAACPRIAVVSAGRHNRFGHPHPDVVRRYETRAIPLYSTARRGLVVVEFAVDGAMTVRTSR